MVSATDRGTRSDQLVLFQLQTALDALELASRQAAGLKEAPAVRRLVSAVKGVKERIEWRVRTKEYIP